MPLLVKAEQDECEPAAPMGKKTSASQNTRWEKSFSDHRNAIFRLAGLK